MKNFNFNLLKSNLKSYLPDIPFWFMVIIIYFLFGFSCYQLYKTIKSYNLYNNRNQKLKDQLTLIQSSKGLSTDEIIRFNQIAAKMVPESANYFELVDSLEELSSKTGFRLYDYSINLPETTPEKLAISVAGRGDTASFFRFLADYKYTSGRLITIESITYSPKSEQEYSLVINFYYKKVPALKPPTTVEELKNIDPDSLSLAITKLSREDIRFIRDVLDKGRYLN